MLRRCEVGRVKKTFREFQRDVEILSLASKRDVWLGVFEVPVSEKLKKQRDVAEPVGRQKRHKINIEIKDLLWKIEKTV